MDKRQDSSYAVQLLEKAISPTLASNKSSPCWRYIMFVCTLGITLFSQIFTEIGSNNENAGHPSCGSWHDETLKCDIKDLRREKTSF